MKTALFAHIVRRQFECLAGEADEYRGKTARLAYNVLQRRLESGPASRMKSVTDREQPITTPLHGDNIGQDHGTRTRILVEEILQRVNHCVPEFRAAAMPIAP